jgi:hypothetical protein
MLGLNVYVFSVETAVLHHFRKALNNYGLWGYRISRNDLRTCKTYALGKSLVA